MIRILREERETKNLMLEMRVTVWEDGEQMAVASAESPDLRFPRKWAKKPREDRDADLCWWFEEAGNVWFEGIWEIHGGEGETKVPAGPAGVQERLL